MINSLHDQSVARLVEIALREDVQSGDITSEATIAPDARSQARLIVKQDGVICGLPIARLVFRSLNPGIEWNERVGEGEHVTVGTVAAEVEGPSIDLLTGERSALNFLQRMSGVATLTRRYVDAVAGSGAKVLDTRKTIPGWRLLDKYAVRTGGGHNHRLGLSDMVLIKDNHIVAAGGISQAVERCLASLRGRPIPIEVETQNLDDVREALACHGVQRIMFDNFTPELMRRAVAAVNHQCETEASGNITLETIAAYAATGVDFISTGAITHSAPALDISMKF